MMVYNARFVWFFGTQNCDVKNVRYSQSGFNVLDVLPVYTFPGGSSN